VIVREETVSGSRVVRSVGEVVEQVARTLAPSDAEIATALGVAPRTVDRWRRGDAVPQRDACQRLSQLVTLGKHVRETSSATPQEDGSGRRIGTWAG